MKARTLLTLLTGVAILQLALLWIQGAQLYRQQETLQALRMDVQELAEIIDQGAAQGNDNGSWAPGRHTPTQRPRLRPVARQEDPPEPGRKEAEAARESAQRAARDSAEAQRKLSISEAARRAEEQAKVDAAKADWVRWVWLSLGGVALAIVLRAWLRRR